MTPTPAAGSAHHLVIDSPVREGATAIHGPSSTRDHRFLPASGAIDAPLLVPNIAAPTEGVVFYDQAAFLDLAGPVLALGGGSAAVDAAF